ncbi:hypothetical protein Bbelb_127060 [Branchiostoma belcheri]|nr:hypothetical protein Bbelb_127060 [Branchiostoma belcheri]
MESNYFTRFMKLKGELNWDTGRYRLPGTFDPFLTSHIPKISARLKVDHITDEVQWTLSKLDLAPHKSGGLLQIGTGDDTDFQPLATCSHGGDRIRQYYHLTDHRGMSEMGWRRGYKSITNQALKAIRPYDKPPTTHAPNGAVFQGAIHPFFSTNSLKRHVRVLRISSSAHKSDTRV